MSKMGKLVYVWMLVIIFNQKSNRLTLETTRLFIFQISTLAQSFIALFIVVFQITKIKNLKSICKLVNLRRARPYISSKVLSISCLE